MTRILLAGKSGQLGWELQKSLAPLGQIIAPGRECLDLARPDTLRHAIRKYMPDVIVNAAGYTTVDRAEAEPGLVHRINAVAPGIIAEEAQKIGALLVHYSTDYVYDGTKVSPYTEEDAPNPVNVYGQSKLDGERAILATGCAYLILRASWIYSSRRTNFVLTMLRLAQQKEELFVVEDQVGSPAWATSLAASSAEILSRMPDRHGASGIYHLSAFGYTTRLEFAREIIALARKTAGPGYRWAQILPIANANFPLPARRPLFAATSKFKIKQVFGVEMPTWQEQLSAFMKTHATTRLALQRL